jgi:Uma2 family endonuclease
MSEKILTQTEKIYTVEDYLKFKHRGSNKREFYNGKIMDTVGSSRRHNLIGSSTTIAIGSRLRGHKCEIYVNDMLVKLSDRSFCYPDVVIVKDEPKFDDGESDVLINPTVIVEVSSKATICHDKTAKLDSYLSMPSRPPINGFIKSTTGATTIFRWNQSTAAFRWRKFTLKFNLINQLANQVRTV